MVPDTVQPVRIASPVVGAVSNCASRGVVSSVRLEGPLSRGIYYRTGSTIALPIWSFDPIRSVDLALGLLILVQIEEGKSVTWRSRIL